MEPGKLADMGLGNWRLEMRSTYSIALADQEISAFSNRVEKAGNETTRRSGRKRRAEITAVNGAEDSGDQL